MKQSVFKSEPDVMGARESLSNMSEQEHCQPSTINQSCLETVGCDVYNQTLTGDVSASITAATGGTNTSGGKVLTSLNAGTLDANYYKGCGERQGTEREVVCVGNGQMNGTRESHKGPGYSENDVSYTLNSVEQHGVCRTEDI